MSDLQCPATLLVSRHGEAEYVVAGVLSDEGGRLTAQGRGQVRHLAHEIRPRRIAAVYSSRMGRAAESAELAASELGLRPVVVDGLQEFSVGDLAGVSSSDGRAQEVFDAWLLGDLEAGCPGAENGHLVVSRFTRALGEIADAHRGETVLVFTHGGAMRLVLPRVSVNVRSGRAIRRLPNCCPAEVEIDGDGWRLLSWGSQAWSVAAGAGSEEA
jgi:broad specificity phosphatase PhoE